MLQSPSLFKEGGDDLRGGEPLRDTIFEICLEAIRELIRDWTWDVIRETLFDAMEETFFEAAFETCFTFVKNFNFFFNKKTCTRNYLGGFCFNFFSHHAHHTKLGPAFLCSVS